MKSMPRPQILSCVLYIWWLTATNTAFLAVQAQTYQRINGRSFLPITQYCSGTETNKDCHEQAIIYPEMHIHFVCQRDFRQSPQDDGQQYWSQNDYQATWGDFIDYVVQLLPGMENNTKEVVNAGLFYAHGGEGKPGWDIPPCGTNRTQGVINLSYLTVALENASSLPLLEDSENARGIDYELVRPYINEGTLHAGVTQYLCAEEDLESLYIGVAQGDNYFDETNDVPFFYPKPEDICPRQEETWWEEWGGAFVLALAVGFVLLLIGAFLYIMHTRRVKHKSSSHGNNEDGATNFATDP